MADIIVACEESQRIVIELRKKGHDAFSCDTQECSGGHPEWHLHGSIWDFIEAGQMFTQSGKPVFIQKWNALIGHPPCTFISKAGARWMYPTAGIVNPERLKKAKQAKVFFMRLWESNIKIIVLENPVPLKIVGLPTHTQAIQPYEYGHEFSKKTLLWIKGLPNLTPTDIKKEYTPYLPSNTGGKARGQKYMYKNISQKESSKTFKGIAEAMAIQWGKLF